MGERFVEEVGYGCNTVVVVLVLVVAMWRVC